MKRPALLLVGAVIVGACSSLPTPSRGLETIRVSDRADASAPFEETAPSVDRTVGWHRVDLGDETPGRFSAVIAVGSTFLAAGGTGSTTVPDSPVVLRSTDGGAWIAERITSTFATPLSLFAVGNRVIAVGAGGTARCAHPYAIDTWTRDENGTWSEAPWVDGFCSGLEKATVLDRHGVAYLLGVGDGEVPLSWSSINGLRWKDLHPNFNDLYPQASLLDGDTISVFGQALNGNIAARRSVDGVAFVGAPFPILGDGISAVGAELLDGQPIVFVSHGPALGAVRRTPTGTWTVTPATGIAADEITRILTVGGRFVALGSDVRENPEIWSSLDGTSWARIGIPADAGSGVGLAGVAVVGGTAVLVGSAETADGTRAVGAIWVGSADLLWPRS
jgi:hypothetical protein